MTNTKIKLMMICFFMFALFSSYGQHHGHGHKSEVIPNKSDTDPHSLKIEKPRRITHSYEQTINGSISDIMPLYCPVREIDWVDGWTPKVVYSNSGLVETDCIFITSHNEGDKVWIVTDFNLKTGHVEMFYHVPGIQVTKLEIQVSSIKAKKTKAVITYSKTSLSDEGDKVLKEFTEKEYEKMMVFWEKSMNYYLKTGKMLKEPD